MTLKLAYTATRGYHLTVPTTSKSAGAAMASKGGQGLGEGRGAVDAGLVPPIAIQVVVNKSAFAFSTEDLSSINSRVKVLTGLSPRRTG